MAWVTPPVPPKVRASRLSTRRSAQTCPRACGFPHSETIREMSEVASLRRRLKERQGPLFAQIKIAAETLPLVMPPRDGALLKNRFREALLGPGAALA